MLCRDGRVHSTKAKPRIQALKHALLPQLEQEVLLLALQSLRQADHFQSSCQQLRLQQQRHRSGAHRPLRGR